MSYELAGTVKVINEEQSFKDGSFRKREIVVTVEDGKFPQDILLEFVQDKISLLDDVQVGDNVQVTFDIRGREWNGRYFNNLQGWRLQKIDAESSGASDDELPPVPDEAPADIEDNADFDEPF